jgi:4-hydroxyacetophenone monooxygenase
VIDNDFDDALIASALEDLSVPTLLLALVHMTGDPKWIRGELEPQGLLLDWPRRA